MNSKLKEADTTYRTKLEHLESENRVLKELQESKMTCEEDRVNFNKTVRNLLLEEIERIEREQVEKENNLAQWREHVMNEMQQEREEFMTTISDLENTNRDLQSQLDSQQKSASDKERQLNSRIEYLTRHKEALEQKVDETTKQINSLQDSLISKRKEQTSDEVKWESEKEELYKNLTNVADILEEKEKLHSQQIKSLEDGYKTTFEVLDKRIKMLNEEKRTLEKQLHSDKGDLVDSIEDCNKQIDGLRLINNYLISWFDEREKVSAREIERMRDEVSNLQMFFDNREVSYIKETRKYAENLERLHALLEKAQERLEEGWDPQKSVSEALRNQVDTLQNQLELKDSQMEKLRKEVINAQNEQRRDITETIHQFREYLVHMNEQELETESKYQQLLEERIDNDKISSERELDDMNKINDSLNEINDLRFKIRELEANNKEKEFIEINSKLIKTEAELIHAKQNLVNYIQSLNTLEDKIKYKLENSIALDENDEILRLKMENVRLNEENSSLLNSKQLVEADLNNRVESLTKKLFTKAEECEELQSKYSHLLSSLNGQREEEIKSWLRRQDLIKRTIEELRKELENTRDRRNMSLAMKDQEHKLTMDEVKLLRIEANKLQKFWDNQFNDWVMEKRTYQNEINSLRENLRTVEDYYKEATELRKEENDLLAEQRHLHREKEEYYIKLANDKIEVEAINKDQRERDEQIREEKSTKIINILRKEIDEAHHEIKKLKDYNNSKIKEIEETYEKKLSIASEKEGVSEYHSQKLKSKLEETEKTYKELHNNEHLEKIILRNQVKTLGKLTEEKIEKTLLEKESIKNKLDQLVLSAGEIQQEETRYKTLIGMKLSKIQTFMKKMHEVLASTYKSEELEMILRDLDEIAEKSGLELTGSTEPISKLKQKISYEDRISAKMHRTKNELNSIKSLEDERQFKNLIEKLSIVELSQRLQTWMQDIEEITAYEKKMLTSEINQWKETMIEKEKRMNQEIKVLKKERDDIMVKLNTLNLNDQTDQKKLSKILNELHQEKETQIKELSNENKKLFTIASKVTQMLDEKQVKEPIKLLEKGRYKALEGSGKGGKDKKSQPSSQAGLRNEVNINDSVRKTQNQAKVSSKRAK